MSQNKLLIISPLRMPRAAFKFGVSEVFTTRRRWQARRFGVANAIDIDRRTVDSYIKLSMPFPRRPRGKRAAQIGHLRDKRIYRIIRYNYESSFGGRYRRRKSLRVSR
jgi:hypothetical protein